MSQIMGDWNTIDEYFNARREYHKRVYNRCISTQEKNMVLGQLRELNIIKQQVLRGELCVMPKM